MSLTPRTLLNEYLSNIANIPERMWILAEKSEDISGNLLKFCVHLGDGKLFVDSHAVGSLDDISADEWQQYIDTAWGEYEKYEFASFIIREGV